MSREKNISIINYENLANAIVLQAVKDYRKASKKLKRKPDDIKAKSRKDDAMRFFKSQWFGQLTKIDAEELIKRLRD